MQNLKEGFKRRSKFVTRRYGVIQNLIFHTKFSHYKDFKEKFGILFADFKNKNIFQKYFCLIDVIRYLIIVMLITHAHQ